ncbi:hypothetical protein H2203_005033 [Taxawa tesnikishii (nom. ined.)]|nr:hypothetical protein H2203_005033 [Dothideales sp. JES 119]
MIHELFSVPTNDASNTAPTFKMTRKLLSIINSAVDGNDAKKTRTKKTKPQCTYCNKRGHEEPTCFSAHPELRMMKNERKKFNSYQPRRPENSHRLKPEGQYLNSTTTTSTTTTTPKDTSPDTVLITTSRRLGIFVFLALLFLGTADVQELASY